MAAAAATRRTRTTSRPLSHSSYLDPACYRVGCNCHLLLTRWHPCRGLVRRYAMLRRSSLCCVTYQKTLSSRRKHRTVLLDLMQTPGHALHASPTGRVHTATCRSSITFGI